jgi:hypothetical protein
MASIGVLCEFHHQLSLLCSTKVPRRSATFLRSSSYPPLSFVNIWTIWRVSVGSNVIPNHRVFLPTPARAEKVTPPERARRPCPSSTRSGSFVFWFIIWRCCCMWWYEMTQRNVGRILQCCTFFFARRQQHHRASVINIFSHHAVTERPTCVNIWHDIRPV